MTRMRAPRGQVSPGAVTPALMFGPHVMLPHGDQGVVLQAPSAST